MDIIKSVCCFLYQINLPIRLSIYSFLQFLCKAIRQFNLTIR